MEDILGSVITLTSSLGILYCELPSFSVPAALQHHFCIITHSPINEKEPKYLLSGPVHPSSPPPPSLRSESNQPQKRFPWFQLLCGGSAPPSPQPSLMCLKFS